MAERYTLDDIAALSNHLATVLARHAEGHATATNVADTALCWAADHGFTRTEPGAVPHLAGFVRRAGVEVSDIETAATDEAIVALGHPLDADALAAFTEHAYKAWGQPLGAGQIRRGWAVNAGSHCEWQLHAAAKDDPGAFPVTYWEAR